MDENERKNSSDASAGDDSVSGRFRSFRKTVHLESPLEFAVVLVVVVCLLSGLGIWLNTPANRFYVRHGMWAELFGRSPKPGPNAAGQGAGQAESTTASNAVPASAMNLQNAPQTAPAAAGIIRIVKQKAVGSTNNSLPNGLEMELLPDREMSPVALTLKFSGEVGEIHSTVESADVSDAQTGILVSKPDTVVLEWRTPPFGPFSPLLLTVFSKDPIKLQGVASIPYRYPYEDGDLK
jgi:hypothetical protein